MEINWQNFLSYPQHLKPETINTLNLIAELLPPQSHVDRYAGIGLWIDKAYKSGLITQIERGKLLNDIAVQM